MTEDTRFHDNGDGSITDNETGLIWTREDSWQSESVWLTWDEADQYAQRLRDNKFCGFNDWRLPEKKESLTLYCPDKTIQDKYEKILYMDPVFPSGCLPTVWLGERLTGNEGYILDFRNGEIRELFKSKSGRMAARPVCGEKTLNSPLPRLKDE